MTGLGQAGSRYGLEHQGLVAHGQVSWNFPPDALHDLALREPDVVQGPNGALVVRTGKCTGRRPQDRYIVEEASSKNAVDWGSVNIPLPDAAFERLHAKVVEHLGNRPLWVRDCYAGADPQSRLRVRVVTERAWHNLFAAQLFIKPPPNDLESFVPDLSLLHAPTCLADPADDGTRSEVFVVLALQRRLVLIGGTHYAGEIKKSIFSFMNYLLPLRGILSMHCSANAGDGGDVALFFGLSGTGKTTLSADPKRRLIGDDEHGWNDRGVFNIEGGCYAKCIKLSPEYEPQIYKAIRRGAVLENVLLDAQGRPDYDSDKITENTRAAYPLDYIDHALIPSIAGHPKTVVFLTCDAFGVLPPVARLSHDQAMYHFLSGYTAKVAGTEAGVTEPQATFSACFGAPFLPLPPSSYAKLLGEKLDRHKVDCWLVNTGWSGGPYGVGARMNIHHTRSIVTAVLTGTLDAIPHERDPLFGFGIPRTCPDVPDRVLQPRQTWPAAAAYETKARELAARFIKNFQAFPDAPSPIAAAGPQPA